jgi:hypothetical protein
VLNGEQTDFLLRRMDMWQNKRKQNLEQQRIESYHRETEGCTFRPMRAEALAASAMALVEAQEEERRTHAVSTWRHGFGSSKTHTAPVALSRSAFEPSALYADNKSWGFDEFVQRQEEARARRAEREAEIARAFEVKGAAAKRVRDGHYGATEPEPFRLSSTAAMVHQADAIGRRGGAAGVGGRAARSTAAAAATVARAQTDAHRRAAQLLSSGRRCVGGALGGPAAQAARRGQTVEDYTRYEVAPRVGEAVTPNARPPRRTLLSELEHDVQSQHGPADDVDALTDAVLQPHYDPAGHIHDHAPLQGGRAGGRSPEGQQPWHGSSYEAAATSRSKASTTTRDAVESAAARAAARVVTPVPRVGPGVFSDPRWNPVRADAAADQTVATALALL